MAKALLVNQIRASKNSEIFMVGTKEGMFSVRKSVLEKSGITLPKRDESFVFEKPQMVIIEEHKKGDYMFPGPSHEATVDSTRTKFQAGLVAQDHEDANKLVYVVGDKPTWNDNGFTVRSFVSVDNYIADLKIQKLEKELALIS